MNKPKCAVKGMVRPGAMCGAVIVGGVYCGHEGECSHKVPACVYCKGTGIDPESFRSPIELPCPACSVPSNDLGNRRAAFGASVLTDELAGNG